MRKPALLRAPFASAGGRWPLVAAAVGIGALLLLGGLGYASRARAQPLAGSVSARSVRPGDFVVVRAQHLPANQSGVVRIESRPRELAAFSAGQDGSVEQSVRIPLDEEAGDHSIRLCWSGSCHTVASVHVTASR